MRFPPTPVGGSMTGKACSTKLPGRWLRRRDRGVFAALGFSPHFSPHFDRRQMKKDEV
jgi:hypothetical protein